jgi:adenine-specific DNA-methyltransferase
VGAEDRFRHSPWLDFMHRRLLLARDLFAPDGAIFVSIDDNEGLYLKVLLDQVFGRAMFVTSFIWRKVDSPNDNKVVAAMVYGEQAGFHEAMSTVTDLAGRGLT